MEATRVYRVTKNGYITLETHFYKQAAKQYDFHIYEGKPGDIIQLLTRKGVNAPWELARKDWL